MNTKFLLSASAVALAASVFPAHAVLFGSNGDASNFGALEVIEFGNTGTPIGANGQALRYENLGGTGINLSVGGVAPGVSLVPATNDGDTISTNITRFELTGSPSGQFGAPGTAFTNFQPATGVTANGPGGFAGELYNGGGLPVQIENDNNVAPGGTTGNTTLRGFGTQRDPFGDELLTPSYGPITIVFDSPVSSVRGLVGSLSAPGSVRLVAYDNSGEIIGVVSSDTNNDNVIDASDDIDTGVSSVAFSTTQGVAAFGLLGLDDLNNENSIRAIAFYQDTADRQGYGFRAISFQTFEETIPVPASILVMAGGLLLLRRNKQNAS